MELAISRAPYACDPELTRGRLYPESTSTSRTAFRRDCDRVIHATAFRRLKHKTQVFVFDEGDHYRTRLTHTLEVAQIARALARRLRLDEDLAEALALAHDLGHPPFGHAGERALEACLSAFGGFDHNAQTLRVVTVLERRYPEFDGLNLTWETLEGLVKHNGPLTDRAGAPLERYRRHGVPVSILDYCYLQDLQLWSFASAEAQVAAIADDIAYDAHDIDDGLRAQLFEVEQIAAVPLPGRIVAAIHADYPALVGAFSREVGDEDCAIKSFLKPRMYRHPRVMKVMDQAADVVRDLFARYSARPQDMPAEWSEQLVGRDEAARARHIADFIAGMTDRYALAEHARLFDSTPELR